MSIKRASYRDIPIHVRGRAAAEARRRLQGVLSDPLASPEQRQAAQQQQQVLRQWASGAPEVEGRPPTEAKEPVPEAEGQPATHTIVLEESLEVQEEN